MNENSILVKLFISICTDCGFNPQAVQGRTRKREIVLVRQIFCYYAANSGLFSLKNIGEIAGVDHATVLYAKKRISGYIECKDKITFDYLEKCKENAQIILGQNRYIQNKDLATFVCDFLETVDFSMVCGNIKRRLKNILKKLD